MASLEQQLRDGLMGNSSGLVRGVHVVLVPENTGVNVVLQAFNPTSALVDVWSGGSACTWIMRSSDKWLVHTLRQGGHIGAGNAMERVPASAAPMDSRSADDWNRYMVQHGRAQPWGPLNVSTYTLSPNCLALLMPENCTALSSTDVLLDDDHGGNVCVWGEGMQDRVVAFRAGFSHQTSLRI